MKEFSLPKSTRDAHIKAAEYARTIHGQGRGEHSVIKKSEHSLPDKPDTTVVLKTGYPDVGEIDFETTHAVSIGSGSGDLFDARVVAYLDKDTGYVKVGLPINAGEANAFLDVIYGEEDNEYEKDPPQSILERVEEENAIIRANIQSALARNDAGTDTPSDNQLRQMITELYTATIDEETWKTPATTGETAQTYETVAAFRDIIEILPMQTITEATNWENGDDYYRIRSVTGDSPEEDIVEFSILTTKPVNDLLDKVETNYWQFAPERVVYLEKEKIIISIPREGKLLENGEETKEALYASRANAMRKEPRKTTVEDVTNGLYRLHNLAEEK